MRLIVTFCEGVADAGGVASTGAGGGVAGEAEAVGPGGADGASVAVGVVAASDDPSGKGTGRKRGMGASSTGADEADEAGTADASSAQRGMDARTQSEKSETGSALRWNCFLSEQEKWIMGVKRVNWVFAR